MCNVKIIKLGNRYKVSNSLVQSTVNPNKFFLIYSNIQEAEWCRVLFKEGEKNYDCKDYFAVDPSGGPFMAIGSKIEDYTIERISEEELTKEEYPYLSKQKKAFTFYMKQDEQKQEVIYTVENESDKVLIPCEGTCVVNIYNYIQTSTDDI